MNDFRCFLMGKCMDDTHALDDMLPDAYEDWIEEQDVEDIIDWAEKWHEKEVIGAINFGRKYHEEIEKLERKETVENVDKKQY